MNKPIWKSKTAWAALGAVITAAGGYATGEMSLVEAILAALAGLGAYGFRDAMREDGPGSDEVDFSKWMIAPPSCEDEGRE